jgi:hypothetical protein
MRIVVVFLEFLQAYIEARDVKMLKRTGFKGAFGQRETI